MDVHFFNQQNDLAINSIQIESVVREVLSQESIQCDEVAIHCVTSSAMCELHRIYFDDPSTTDCISFPIDPKGESGYKVLGEVFVCPQTAITYSESNPSTPYDEVTLYVVHGLLHLIGYDDLGDEEPEMRKAETRLLNHLKEKNLMLREDHCTL